MISVPLRGHSTTTWTRRGGGGPLNVHVDQKLNTNLAISESISYHCFVHWISEQVHHWSLKCDQIYPHIMLFKMRYMLMFLQNWFLSKHQLSVDVFLKTPILRLNSSTHPVYHDQMSLPIMVAYHTNKVFCLCMLTWYLNSDIQPSYPWQKEEEMRSNIYVFLFVYRNQNGSNSWSHLLKEFFKEFWQKRRRNVIK